MSASGKGKRRSCRKRRYRTKVDALIAMANIQYKDKRAHGHVEQRAYYHHACRAWHLTSQPHRASSARINFDD